MLSELFWMIAGGAYTEGGLLNQAGNRAAEQQYVSSRGYNKERQQLLERMATSADAAERREFERLCGFIPHGERERKQAVREISIREGWRYHDAEELFDDPAYVKLVGGKYPDWKDPNEMRRKWEAVDKKAREHIAEIDRRRVWTARCEHGDEVHVFPISFPTEEAYRYAVVRAYLAKGSTR